VNTENIKIRTAGPEDIDLLVTWRMEVLAGTEQQTLLPDCTD